MASLQDSIQNDPGYWVLLFDLFTAGRRNPEIRREVVLLSSLVGADGYHALVNQADEAEIAEVDRVRADALRAFEAFLP